MARASPAKRPSSRGSDPSSAASGMPWTLPDPLVSGLFMSPCASTQISPVAAPRCFWNAAAAATDPAPRL
jgi:hypothetical protein